MNTNLSNENARPDRQQTYRVIAGYEAAYPDPLIIRAGERLTVGDRKTTWEGWLWCTNHDGQSRWVPGIYVQRQGNTGLALCDYDATELTVHAGEELVADQEAADWLWCTNQQGQSGWVPIANLAPVDQALHPAED